ncbi:hypothetical protein NGRA_0532 [Nosema granulosis]|uniref:Uncharacterized protein n=1 Tax=Nosema granulosis TaxID=83296 RepID=A0A9P6H3F1_9MICR|nr:hypothetical protein NGRA_0532 [Nosema granulosis]
MEKDTQFNKELEEIQHVLDNKYTQHAKRLFDCNYQYFKDIKEDLEKRDKIVEKYQEQLGDFWEKAFLNFDMAGDFLPCDSENNFDASWIKSLKTELRDNYTYYIRIELKENEYVANKVLEKKIYLVDQDVDTEKIEWKTNTKHPIFMFFETDDQGYEMFDILFELYVTGYFYYSLCDE